MRHFQQPPDHLIMLVRPIPSFAQTPAIDNVAHEIQRIALDRMEKIAQQSCLTSSRPEVDVRDPNCPKPHFGLVASGLGLIEPCRKLGRSGFLFTEQVFAYLNAAKQCVCHQRIPPPDEDYLKRGWDKLVANQ
jgi:hypothetical protein